MIINRIKINQASRVMQAEESYFQAITVVSTHQIPSETCFIRIRHLIASLERGGNIFTETFTQIKWHVVFLLTPKFSMFSADSA